MNLLISKVNTPILRIGDIIETLELEGLHSIVDIEDNNIFVSSLTNQVKVISINSNEITSHISINEQIEEGIKYANQELNVPQEHLIEYLME